MVDCETIRTNGTRCAAVPDGPGDKVGGERGNGRVKRVVLIEGPLDTPGSGVRCAGDC